MKISNNHCRYLIELSESKNLWKRVKTGGSYYSTLFEVEDGEIKDLIIQYCSEYLNLDISTINVGILKYIEGDLIQKHVDSGSATNLLSKDFIYNINILLNDDYEGGEFYLNDQPYLKPVGEIYHYKSSEYHEVKKVKRGVRYCALFYIRYGDIKNWRKLKTII
jgi:predicted 2-oxoglutarate/Fe(II)-dependent dioxygenase YbiX